MKMSLRISLILIAAAVLLLGFYEFLRFRQDRKAPEILFEEAALTEWSEEMGQDALLEGVQAIDDRDGDVTDTLRVGRIIAADDRKGADVIYYAKDRSENVATTSRQIRLAAVKKSSEFLKDHSSQEVELASENDTRIAELSVGAPHLYLNSYNVSLDAGEVFQPQSYVAEITDDRDSVEYLKSNIEVSGSYDMNKAGRYTLELYTFDSYRNRSNRARIYLTVE